MVTAAGREFEKCIRTNPNPRQHRNSTPVGSSDSYLEFSTTPERLAHRRSNAACTLEPPKPGVTAHVRGQRAIGRSASPPSLLPRDKIKLLESPLISFRLVQTLAPANTSMRRVKELAKPDGTIRSTINVQPTEATRLGTIPLDDSDQT